MQIIDKIKANIIKLNFPTKVFYVFFFLDWKSLENGICVCVYVCVLRCGCVWRSVCVCFGLGFSSAGVSVFRCCCVCFTSVKRACVCMWLYAIGSRWRRRQKRRNMTRRWPTATTTETATATAKAKRVGSVVGWLCDLWMGGGSQVEGGGLTQTDRLESCGEENADIKLYNQCSKLNALHHKAIRINKYLLWKFSYFYYNSHFTRQLFSQKFCN